MSIVNAIRARFGFRRRKNDQPLPDDTDDDIDDEYSDDIVWDNPNPFAPPDPSEARLRSLIQAQIVQMGRYESIGPLQLLPGQVESYYESESDDEIETGNDDAEDDDGDSDAEDEDYDAEASDNDGDDGDDADSDTAIKHRPIALPQLLPIALRFPCPSTSPSPSASSHATADDEDNNTTPWADLAHVYNDTAEEEQRARKARRDAYRSRLKAFTLLGTEASPAI